MSVDDSRMPMLQFSTPVQILLLSSSTQMPKFVTPSKAQVPRDLSDLQNTLKTPYAKHVQSSSLCPGYRFEQVTSAR